MVIINNNLRDALGDENWYWSYASKFKQSKFDSLADLNSCLEENEIQGKIYLSIKGNIRTYIRPFRESGRGPRIAYDCLECSKIHLGKPIIRVGDKNLEYFCNNNHRLI